MDKSNRLVILGGNPETAAFIKRLKDYNIYTIVIDPNDNAPAKKISNESHEIDVLNVDAVINLLSKIKFDAIIVGVADILVTPYYEICKRLNLNCYANSKTIKAFGSKDGFNRVCEINKIQVIPRFQQDNNIISQNDLPVMVKPVDNGAGVGMSICYKINHLNDAINHAKDNSKSKRVLVEKYMDCDDLFAYYTFINGNIYLSATADRHKSKINNSGSPVCIGATYPSKHHQEFVENVNPKILVMLKSLDVSDGVLNIQFFKDNEAFYAYDPGFRLQGEAPHIHILHALGVDQREILCNFAFSKSSKLAQQSLKDRHVGDNIHAVTAWVLLKEGVIKKIDGMKDIKALDSFREVIQRLFINDHITKDMIDTERQVFARFYFQNKNIFDLKKDIKKFSSFLRVNSEKSCLISDIFDESFI